jgi:NADPH:quinone reductase-like Zn-dependent oxidoreductase
MNRQLRALALSRFVGQRLTMLIATVHTPDLKRLATLITEGKITPRIDRTYQLHQVPDAMRCLEAGEACGKVAITVRARHRPAAEDGSGDTHRNDR